MEIDFAAIAWLAMRGREHVRLLHKAGSTATIFLPIALPLRGGQRLVVTSGMGIARPDPVLIAALRKAHAMLASEHGMPVMQVAPKSPYDCAILRLAFLSPDIQRDIMKGLQPLTLSLESMRGMTIPLDWTKQRRALGWNGFQAPCSDD